MSQVDTDNTHLIALTSEIVSAYVSNNHVQSVDLPKLLNDVFVTVCAISTAGRVPEAPPKASSQEIKRSITPEALISFEDGKPYKTLRRHLTLRGLTPEAYRTKWGLDSDYPMTAQSYSEQRSQLARSLGLGQQRRKTPEAPRKDPPAPEPPATEPPKSRGRRKPEA